MNAITDRDSALAFLTGRINYERTGRVPYRSNQLKLARMRRLLTELGEPQLACPTIHIAGTKGKGSTAAMTAAILQAAGMNVGLYSSPHLERIEERFTVNGRQCDESEFVALVRRVAAAVARVDQHCDANNESGPTFFEITTSLAWMRFAAHQVDCAVAEVGLGGRLDSTNVCHPTMTAITSISLDHVQQLGNTLALIAREKAGIIKPGVPMAIGPLVEEAAEQVRELAAERGSEVFEYGAAYAAEPSELGPQAFDYRDGEQHLSGLRLGLLGAHQHSNAALAVFLAKHFCRLRSAVLPEAAIREGLQRVRCAARVELMQESPWVVLDAAHNAASAAALRTSLEQLPATGPRILVFATSRDKDAAAVLNTLAPMFDRIILTRFRDNPRALAPDKLLKKWTPGDERRVGCEDDSHHAWRTALESAAEDGLVCVAGSFFLAADLRPVMLKSVESREPSRSNPEAEDLHTRT